MTIVSDTSAVSNLIQIGKIELLKQLFGKIIITPAVRQELYQIKLQKVLIEKFNWIEVRTPQDKNFVNKLLVTLDLGESESIALAVEMNNALLIIDEYLGREIAKEYDLKITGLIGILILAKQKELLSTIRPVLADLEDIGFRLSQKLVTHILNLVKE